MLRNNLCVIALVLATGCMSGCGVFQKPPPVIQKQALTPPDSLMQDCAHADRPKGTKVSDLAQGVINERAVLEGCDWADKSALRAWAAGVKSGK
jgi:hypothetical protein